MSDPSRRRVVGLGLGGAAATLGGGRTAWAAREAFFMRTRLPIGLQLYTLGPGLASDLEGQLSQVAGIGYRTVEMAGYLGRTPKALRAAFDKAGLTCVSSHVQGRPTGADPSLADLDRLIADARVIGIRSLVLPMFPVPDHIQMTPQSGEDRHAVLGRLAAQMTLDDWKATADLLNSKGAALKAAGLRLGYHNHNVEFAPVGGTTGLEFLLANTDPAVVHFEMDAGWVVAAGHDPLALLKAHPHRFRQMHVKDIKATTKPNFAFQQDPTEVGSGIIDWKRLLAASYAAGVRDFFVEQEPPFEKPRLEAVKVSFDHLKALVA
ncbi:MAG: Xylose isomerase [Phenylobacterium sp.]|uniref:sugar phosphate isomerase/epimerase family protein n=1 Tax=Phenylobacterium sp. TaxID=1871053 RepID=UPI00262E2BD7|nr:sugar phosphate isomerase/epimerase [Phenylobacterium sp.]MDB5499414.1 Xylose isomerase [Phenylobacterium sp.]